MKRTKKGKKPEAHVSSKRAIEDTKDNQHDFKKLMAKSQRVLRAIDKARRDGDRDELNSLQSELKKLQYGMQILLSPAEAEEEMKQKPTPKIAVMHKIEGERWVLVRDMHFGLVKAGFSKGTTFTVNREKGSMVCDDTGQTFDNIKDLDIAARVGVAQPLDDETETIVQEQHEKRKQLAQERLSKQQNSDEALRGRIITSDQDIIKSIPCPHKMKSQNKGGDAVRQLEAPTNMASLIKPRHRQAQNIIVSDGTQQGSFVDGERGNVIMGTKKNQFWDSKNSGERMADIRRVTEKKGIERDENGQLIVRGMGVIRDDSRVGSGPALNEGMVISLSKEELREKRMLAKEQANQRKGEVKEKRKKAGVEVREPEVDEVAQDEVDEYAGLADEVTPSPKQLRQAKGKTQQLLRRRY